MDDVMKIHLLIDNERYPFVHSSASSKKADEVF